MAKTAGNITILYLDSLTVNSVEIAGYLGDEDSVLGLETEELEVKASNATETVTRFRMGRKAELAVPILENVLTHLRSIVGDDSLGTDLAIPSYTVSGTGKDASGTTHTISGTAQWQEKADLLYNIKKASSLKGVLRFVRTNGILVTINGENY